MRIHKQIGITPKIEKAILKLLKKFSGFENKKLKIVIKESINKKALKDMEGVGGYCPATDLIQISIDPDHPKYKVDPMGAVSRSFIHELYHAMRFTTGASRPNGTMLDCLVDEGLADQFVFETTGRLPIWNRYLPQQTIRTLMKRFLKIKNYKVSDRSYQDWFIKGSTSKKIPRWVGYSLGLRVVRTYQRKNDRLPVIKMISTAGEEIFNGGRD